MNGTKQLLKDVPLLYLPPQYKWLGDSFSRHKLNSKPISWFYESLLLNGVFFIPKYPTMLM